MYSYDSILKTLNVDNNSMNRFYLKSIIYAMVKNNEALFENQRISVDIEKIKYLWNLLKRLSLFFDYKYNSKEDLTSFVYFLLNDKDININAIFCPGYTANGYKNYIGSNNTERLKILKQLRDNLVIERKKINFKITLADIFLENIDVEINSKLYEELNLHKELFFSKANEFFSDHEIIFLSENYLDDEYFKGFVDKSILFGKTYENFYKNNIEFYKKMGWNDKEIRIRNDKLYTIYNIISKYIYEQENGIYLPMETMYSRSKVMTNNNVCTLYLHK